MRQPGILLLVACGALAGAAPSTASAQDFEQICAGMPTDAERAACVTGAQAVLQGQAQTAPPAPSPVRPRTESGGFLGLGIFGGGRDTGSAPLPGPATGLGADVVNFQAGYSADGDAGNQVSANILRFREHVPGVLEYELDNGQLWRQTSGAKPRVSQRDPIPVEMWESWAGGYRMRLVEQERVLKVERVR